MLKIANAGFYMKQVTITVQATHRTLRVLRRLSEATGEKKYALMQRLVLAEAERLKVSGE